MAEMRHVGTGELTYNGVNFDSLHQSKVQAVPIYDDADRAVKYIEYTLSVQAYIVIGGAETTDQTMETLRRDLMAVGRSLVYSDKGFGLLEANAGGRMKDVKWGPKPELLTFKPVGSNLAAFIEWRVKTCLPECDGSAYEKALSMACYDVNYAIDMHGMHVITISGAFEIPITYREGGDNRVSDNADAYRERAMTKVPRGFQREANFHLSKDRTRMEFTLVDKEIPVPLPPGCTMAEVRHRASGNLQGGFRKWRNVISGTIRVNPTRPKSDAYDRFFKIAFSRINWTAQLHQEQRGHHIIMQQFDVEENIFGMDSRFALAYDVVGLKLKNILVTSGLWRPIEGFTWDAFGNSLAKNAHHSRGNLKARYASSDDIIVDLCDQPRVQIPEAHTDEPLQQFVPGNFRDVNPEDLQRAASGGRVRVGGDQFDGDPETTWLLYSSYLRYEQDDHVIRHKPLDGTVTECRPTVDAFGNVRSVAGMTEYEQIGVSVSVEDVLQRLTGPSITVTLEGGAARLFYPINPPRLIRFGNLEVVQQSQVIQPGALTAINGIPVNALFWRITYLLRNPPLQLQIPINPLLGTGGAE